MCSVFHKVRVKLSCSCRLLFGDVDFFLYHGLLHTHARHIVFLTEGRANALISKKYFVRTPPEFCNK